MRAVPGSARPKRHTRRRRPLPRRPLGRRKASAFFTDCPLCFKSFHPSLIHSHVDTCIGAAEETTAREKARATEAEKRRAARAEKLTADDIGANDDFILDVSRLRDDDDDDDDDDAIVSADEQDIQQAEQLPAEERVGVGVGARLKRTTRSRR